MVAKTAANGSLTYEAQYEAYGKRTAEQGATDDRQKANTKDEDPTGLLNEGFRYRDLETGTFITRDPLGFVDGPNMYAYVVQNPWTSFDPEGLKTKKEYRKDIKRYKSEKKAALKEARENKANSREKADIEREFGGKIRGAEKAMADIDQTAKSINERANAEVVNAEDIDDDLGRLKRGEVEGDREQLSSLLYHYDKHMKLVDSVNSVAQEAFWTGVGMATGELVVRWAGMGIKALRSGAGFSDDAFNHGLKYADRVRARGVNDPVSHNFPYSFDDGILATKPIPKNNGYNMYQKPGSMNGKDGVFEMGVTKDGVIDHRFFRPNK